ncbi:hypothetical protein DPMN_103139 [Dreissena polymorpha]|uniref:Uncharacterized protein n=1 Tax=Dreissena polymorpha TaxID=45954 RepID=A0A9D4K2J4_DREPO|nr:hypothetical protein DPMN_103139 [Dreissena polymorpha]
MKMIEVTMGMTMIEMMKKIREMRVVFSRTDHEMKIIIITNSMTQLKMMTWMTIDMFD